MKMEHKSISKPILGEFEILLLLDSVAWWQDWIPWEPPVLVP